MVKSGVERLHNQGVRLHDMNGEKEKEDVLYMGMSYRGAYIEKEPRGEMENQGYVDK